MHFLEATFRTAVKNQDFVTPTEVKFVGQLPNRVILKVCRNGYNIAKDLYNLGLIGITRYRDHERFFVVIEFCCEPSV